jgi:cystathionine gamma-synthase
MSAEIATQTVHAGESLPRPHDALTTPIVATATYRFADTAELRAYFDGHEERQEYGRYGNPTVRVAEQRLAALEGAPDALCFASGMAAFTTTVLALTKAGDHVVMTSDCYRRSRQFVTRGLARFGVESTLIAPGDHAALAAAIGPRTRLVVAESPTNPYLRVADIAALAEIVRGHRQTKLLVDATFATPVNQRPLALGADLVLHSATKYLGGHNDLLAGVVAGPAPLLSLIREQRDVLGGILDPHPAYLLVRGLKTLALRVSRQNQTSQLLAERLEAHPAVTRVHYPGLPSHPDHALAQRTMSGFGGVVSFEVAGGEHGASRVIDACRLCTLAPSLGGVETLIEQPALMSYYELSSEERAAIGIKDELIRLAVGIEDPEDLWRDLAQALDGHVG